METLNEVFLFELDLLAERLHLSRFDVQDRIKLRSSKLEAIESHEAPMSDVVKYYERLLTMRLVYDAVERFKVALDFIMKKDHMKRHFDVVKRMDIPSWRFRHALEGNTKYFNEAFLQDFNETFDEIFDLDWIMYGEGLIFKDWYLIFKHYGLKSPKEVEEARQEATIANWKSYDYDKHYDTFRRKTLIKMALNPVGKESIYASIRELSAEIVKRRSDIDKYENLIKKYQQDIRQKKLEIAKMKQKILRHRDYMVGRAFLDMYNDIEKL